MTPGVLITLKKPVFWSNIFLG